MEEAISLPRKIAHMIRNKEKAGYITDPFTVNTITIQNYCKQILTMDFIKTHLFSINLEEFVTVLDDLLRQESLIQELRR